MIGCAARQPKSVSTTVKTSDSSADAAIDRRTPTSLRAPKRCPMQMPKPPVNPCTKQRMKYMKVPVEPTAASASAPIVRPTMTVSASV